MNDPPSPERVEAVVSLHQKGALSIHFLFDMLRVDRDSIPEADFLQEIDHFYTILLVLES